jgi:hypothetical protein
MRCGRTVFGELGFRAASFAELAARSGMSVRRQSLLRRRYFAPKEIFTKMLLAS